MDSETDDVVLLGGQTLRKKKRQPRSAKGLDFKMRFAC